MTVDSEYVRDRILYLKRNYKKVHCHDCDKILYPEDADKIDYIVTARKEELFFCQKCMNKRMKEGATHGKSRTKTRRTSKPD